MAKSSTASNRYNTPVSRYTVRPHCASASRHSVNAWTAIAVYAALPLYIVLMRRVSSPELDRELAGPHASTSVTRAPRRNSESAVQPPNAPAPTTTMCGAEGLRDIDSVG